MRPWSTLANSQDPNLIQDFQTEHLRCSSKRIPGKSKPGFPWIKASILQSPKRDQPQRSTSNRSTSFFDMSLSNVLLCPISLTMLEGEIFSTQIISFSWTGAVAVFLIARLHFTDDLLEFIFPATTSKESTEFVFSMRFLAAPHVVHSYDSCIFPVYS